MLQNVVPTSCGPGTQGTVTTPQLNADYVDILNIRSQIIEIQRSFLRYVAHVFKNMQMQMPFFDCEHVEKKLKYTGSSSVFGPHTINSKWTKMNVEDKLEEQKMTTKRKQRWFGFSKCIFQLLLIFAMLLQTPCPVVSEKSKHYYMQSLCKNHFLQQLYRKIDGAVLWSQNERNLDCIITFQTQSILQRFMLRFEMLQLDCNDHLYVYDGAHAVSLPKHDISCRDTKQSFRSVLTRTNFVTLKYVTDNWGTDANGFKLVVTSVKESKHTCKDFKCKTREFCIHPDLLCDGINHCGDDSDESVKNLCQNETTSTIFGIDATWFVLIVVCVLLVLSTFVVGISICACRRQELNTPNNANTTSVQLHHGAESNGSSKYLHHYQVYEGTLTREHTQIPSQLTTSGNWHHPAGLLGYHRIPHNLLKMATKVRPIWYLASFAN